MNRCLRVLYCLAPLLCLAPHLVAQREDTVLTTGWKFIRQDVPLATSSTDWKSVSIPHTWNALDGQLGKARDHEDRSGYYRGPCWYDLALDVPASWKGRRVFIHFDAASLVAKTYLNGTLLGEHRGGFTAFCYELTSHLHYGAVNDLRVQVDNSHQEDVPPLSGDFNIDGGLYRPVHLIVTDPICITPLYFASPGVFITTHSLAPDHAAIEIKTLVSNGAPTAADTTIATEITDASGLPVGSASTDQTLAAGTTTPVVQTVTIARPHLWQGRRDPYLYVVTVRIIRNGQTVDTVTQPLGLRTVALSQARGFLLNGEPYPIHGVNLHQDSFNEGWALSHADHERDLHIILDMGVTAVRLTHYPQSEYIHTLADRSGLLLWEEISLVNEIRDIPAFAANAEQQLREMILQRYNHPSVAFWGMFNELENNRTPHPDALLTHLKAVIHELDPRRIDVGASDHNNRSYNKIPDGISFNQYPGWYGKGQPGDMAAFIEARAAEVGHRIGISEFGGGANPAQHQEGPPQKVRSTGQFHPEEWQTHIHETEWGIIQNNPNVWGCFIWAMFDFPSSGRNEGDHPGLNDKGLVTQDRLVKKDAYYFYKANWNPAPMVYIASRRSTSRKLATTAVEVFSNCPSVELLVNGHSLGRVTPDEIHVARWPAITLTPGENQIKALASAPSGPLADTCVWTLEQQP